MTSKIKHICFIVPSYPTKNDPVYTFVKELICSIADQGVKCSVIAPQSITNYIVKKKRKRPYFWRDYTDKNNKIDIFQPIHAPFLNINLFGLNVSGFLTEKVIEKTFIKEEIKPDILYAHFWHSGVIAGGIGMKQDIPTFVATGESKIWVDSLYSKKKMNESLKSVKGVISVSTKNKLESISLNLTSDNKITVIPNAINNNMFYKINKQNARDSLGIKEDEFIVAYLGAFTDRKGVMRLSKAIEHESDIKAIYIGAGELKPMCNNALFIGKLPHNQIYLYLNAADVFVLPTLAEGCCNAIIEAMACGLPIVSSNSSFNDDILNNQNSIRVDSQNIDEITDAINYLKDNVLIREEMSRQSIQIAKELDINNRSYKIMRFIESKLDG